MSPEAFKLNGLHNLQARNSNPSCMDWRCVGMQCCEPCDVCHAVQASVRALEQHVSEISSYLKKEEAAMPKVRMHLAKKRILLIMSTFGAGGGPPSCITSAVARHPQHGIRPSSGQALSSSPTKHVKPHQRREERKKEGGGPSVVRFSNRVRLNIWLSERKIDA